MGTAGVVFLAVVLLTYAGKADKLSWVFILGRPVLIELTLEGDDCVNCLYFLFLQEL